LLGQKAPDALKAEHLALNTQLLKLSARLGSLYSFHFVPKPHEQEFNVRPKVSSIALEEKIPTAHAASSSLAPEEVYGAKRGDACLAEQQELTQRERKALRQKKKRLHKRKDGEKQEQAKLGAALLPESSAAKKLAAAQVGASTDSLEREEKIPTETDCDR
jgi:U3 small nucleolar ribonucleoprotein component|tara:strand:+ start:1029 stop:1511 length:483 start_codon:yes stop_codon:yes gene_type:complete